MFSWQGVFEVRVAFHTTAWLIIRRVIPVLVQRNVLRGITSRTTDHGFGVNSRANHVVVN